MRYSQRPQRPQRNPLMRRPLTNQQIFRASTLWEENRSLGEIAEEIGCSVYQLGFLYRELLTNLRRVGVVTSTTEDTTATATSARIKYALGFRDENGIQGFTAGPFLTLKEALDYSCSKDCDCNVIVRVGGDSLYVVAVWNDKNACWILQTKAARA